MRKRRVLLQGLRVFIAGLLVAAGSQQSWAIADTPWRLFLAGAYPFALGTTNKWVDGEYGVLGGFAYKEDEWPVGLQFEGMTYRMGFSHNAESFTGSEGYMQMTAGTANVTWTPEHFKQNTIYPRLIGGLGVYNRVLRTTETRLYTNTCSDPWWGSYPCTGTGDVVTGSTSQTKLGFNVGTSVEFEGMGETMFFVEVRYHHVLTSHSITQFLPLNFGIRW